jgi:hypothetical protein
MAAGREESGSPVINVTGSGVLVGDHGVQINNFHRPPPPGPDRRIQVGDVPRGADCFVKRKAQGDLLEALQDADTVVVTPVLVGMGGVGKTQLAANYARTQWEKRNVDLLVWVNASSRPSIISTYAKAANRIDGIDSAAANELTAAERFRAWLTEESGTRWLIVLDDVADPDDLLQLDPPPSKVGSTIITTRVRDPSYYSSEWKVLKIGLFEPGQALQYLRDRLRDHPGALAGAEDLARELGYLPLALASASAYILFFADMEDTPEGPSTCAEYSALLADRRRELDEVMPSKGIDRYTRTMAATWSISIEQVDRQFPSGIARRLMVLLSLLDPNGIPLTIVDTPEILARLGAGSTDEVRAAAQALRLFSLIEFADADEDRVTVHMLVQRAVRETTTTASLDEATRALADSMAAQWPAQQHSTDAALLLRSNALALYTVNPGPLRTPGLHRLLFLLGNGYGQSGQLDQARDYFGALRAEAVTELGADARDTLHVRQREAYWLGFSGRADLALAEFEDIAADQTRVLGADDRDTLVSRHNIARFRGRSGNRQGAVQDLGRLIADETRELGATDIETLKSRNILGYWLNLSGEPRAAVAELEAVLPLNEENLGRDHDETLRARNDLAMAMAATGDYPGAITKGERVVQDRTRVLGPKDPATLSSRAYVAHWRTLAGQDSLAELLTIVADHGAVLGSRHPNTLRAEAYRIMALAASGDIPGAVAEMDSHLGVIREVFGQKHILTTQCDEKLREWRGEA